MYNRSLCLASIVLISSSFSSALAQDNNIASEANQLPITNSPSAVSYQYVPLTFSQQQARFEAEQRMYRMEWNKWIGHSPLRPHANSGYISGNSYHNYFSNDRSIFINTGRRGWYW